VMFLLLWKSTIDHCGSRCKGWLGPPLTHTYIHTIMELEGYRIWAVVMESLSSGIWHCIVHWKWAVVSEEYFSLQPWRWRRHVDFQCTTQCYIPECRTTKLEGLLPFSQKPTIFSVGCLEPFEFSLLLLISIVILLIYA
jgi:hypothetical protein